MRATSLLKNLLGINKTRVVGFAFADERLVLQVRPTSRVPVCGNCMRAVREVHDARVRRWRHLDFGGMLVFLEWRLRRVRCSRCGVTTEAVPWAAPQSWFTYAFEQTAAYLAQVQLAAARSIEAP